MKTKVSNCGKYSCTHCNYEGQCTLPSISITPEGKCAQYQKSAAKAIPIAEQNEQDEHTNMC